MKERQNRRSREEWERINALWEKDRKPQTLFCKGPKATEPATSRHFELTSSCILSNLAPPLLPIQKPFANACADYQI